VSSALAVGGRILYGPKETPDNAGNSTQTNIVHPHLLNQLFLLCTCQCTTEIAIGTSQQVLDMIVGYSMLTNAPSSMVGHIFILLLVSTYPNQFICEELKNNSL
jgi:hypothetical protein